MEWITKGSVAMVNMPVSRVDKAEKWYARNLGFETRSKMSQPVFCEMEQRSTGLRIGLAEVQEFKLGQASIMLEVSDIETAQKELSANGVDVSEIAEIPGMAKVLTFEDPDGNPWMLRQRV